MKYIVVKAAKDAVDWHMVRNRPDGRQVGMVANTPLFPSRGHHGPDNQINDAQLDRQPYFICSTEEEANGLAEFMTKNNPGTEYVVGELKCKYFCPPGKVSKTEFTAKGALPA